MTTLPHNTALLVIDVQKAFDDPKWGTRNNLDAEANVAKLLKGWRDTGRPVIHIQHRTPRLVACFPRANLDSR
jgi:nicotinamidase-related amidase